MKHLIALGLLVSAVPLQEGPPEPAKVAERVRIATGAFEKAQRKLEEALLELGPAAIPELERISGTLQGPQKEAVRRSLEQIKRHREPIEKLIAQLGEDRIETREKATTELRRIGSPARPYLEAALRSEDPETRARAKVLLVMISPQDRDQVRWAAIADALKQRLALLEPQMKQGLVSNVDVFKAKREYLKARCKAGQITVQEYVKEAREIAERISNLAQVNFNNGVITRKDWMVAKLGLLYLDRRLGTSGDREIEELQMRWIELAQADKAGGRLGEPEMLRELAAFLTDPDEDLDE